MTPEQLGMKLASLDPSALRSALEATSRALSAKAEQVYTLDPNNNGPLAQPYADAASLLDDAVRVFDTAGSVVTIPEPVDTWIAPDMPSPTTPDEPSTVESSDNPWGRW